jgi:hypothetical protein
MSFAVQLQYSTFYDGSFGVYADLATEIRVGRQLKLLYHSICFTELPAGCFTKAQASVPGDA